MVAELDISFIDFIFPRLTQGLAVMIGRPLPPAAPKSGRQGDRPCHSKVAGQTYCLRNMERATTTVGIPKTLLKCLVTFANGDVVCLSMLTSVGLGWGLCS